MLDRSSTELELRRMLDVATGLDPNVLADRWRVAVTAYPLHS